MTVLFKEGSFYAADVRIEVHNSSQEAMWFLTSCHKQLARIKEKIVDDGKTGLPDFDIFPNFNELDAEESLITISSCLLIYYAFLLLF